MGTLGRTRETGQHPKDIVFVIILFPRTLFFFFLKLLYESLVLIFFFLNPEILIYFLSFIYLFIYGCVGSSFLCEGFL